MNKSNKQPMPGSRSKAQVLVHRDDDSAAFFAVAIVVVVGFVMANEVTARYALIKESLCAVTAIGALFCLALPRGR